MVKIGRFGVVMESVWLRDWGMRKKIQLAIDLKHSAVPNTSRLFLGIMTPPFAPLKVWIRHWLSHSLLSRGIIKVYVFKGEKGRILTPCPKAKRADKLHLNVIIWNHKDGLHLITTTQWLEDRYQVEVMGMCSKVEWNKFKYNKNIHFNAFINDIINNNITLKKNIYNNVNINHDDQRFANCTTKKLLVNPNVPLKKCVFKLFTYIQNNLYLTFKEMLVFLIDFLDYLGTYKTLVSTKHIFVWLNGGG